MTEQEQRVQMVALAKSLFERGYATGGAGNLSVRLDDNRVLTTPTGSCFGRLDPETLSVVSMTGEHLSGSKPSKEASFHLEIYKNREQAGAIVHLHSTYLTALSCLDGLDKSNAIQAFTPYYVMRVGKLPVVDYFNPGDPCIGMELGKLAPDFRAYLLANHGPVVTGKDLVDATDNAEELEETAKLYFQLKGSKVAYLSDENVAYLETRGA
ncbi:3-oxo-tetronate 4-phosphate decarboxylase [Vibrio superstes]|uniref:3-oxo-tetronate 4-phosphate decarboxylase n=1 Tax=Vibrio superstes NBRC 103154 TaxID=1219062 RepID=A0A511QKX1_9VIBR|nr:aldolase [Vibrio superstes]GEM77968.1 putative aldolase class 2 protein [Vibrio superstes NBRC 103154]